MTFSKKEIENLIDIVHTSINHLYEKDSSLFQVRVHERSIAFKFGVYFQELINESEFESLDLDFEYNKRENDNKITPSRPNGSYPDMVLHRRGTQDQNKLIIEFKCSWNRTLRHQDFIKLQEYTDQNLQSGYYYGLGIFLEFGIRREEVEIVLFQNGELVSSSH